MGREKFSIGKAISFGWDTMKSNIGFFIGLLVIVFAISIALNGAVRVTEKAPLIVIILVQLAAIFINVFIQIGLVRIALIFTAQKKPGIGDLFKGLPVFLKYFIVSLLYGAIVIIGLILLIIPGIIFAIKYLYSGYLVIDKGMGPIQALKESAQITRGAKWNLLVFFILLLLINTAGMLCLLIGLFVTIPIVMIAMAHAYRQLSKTLPQPQPAGPAAPGI